MLLSVPIYCLSIVCISPFSHCLWSFFSLPPVNLFLSCLSSLSVFFFFLIIFSLSILPIFSILCFFSFLYIVLTSSFPLISSSFLCLSLLSLPFQSWYPRFSNHFPCLSLALAIPLPSSCLSKAFASTHLLRGALFSEPYLSGVPSRWEDACFWKGSIVPLGEQGDSQL